MPDFLASVAINASNSSFPDFVENAGEVMLVLLLERSAGTTVSTARPANADLAVRRRIDVQRKVETRRSNAREGGGTCWSMGLVNPFFHLSDPGEVVSGIIPCCCRNRNKIENLM